MSSETEQLELPYWETVKLSELIERMTNGTTAKQNKDGVGVPVSRIETIAQGVINFERVGYISEPTAKIREQFALQQNDILFSHINSANHLGKTAIYKLNQTLLHGMNLLLIRPSSDVVEPIYLNFYFEFLRYSGVFIGIAQHAVNQASINQAKMNTLEISLPPLKEQKRIVEKLEQLLSELDKAVDALKSAQQKLKTYRRAVLKAAVEGELSKAWREVNKERLEPADELLRRILAERRRKWEEAELEKMRAKGKEPKDDKWKEKYKEPERVIADNLPTLPDKWAWVTISQVAPLQPGYAFSSTQFKKDGVRLLKGTNVRDGWIFEEEISYWNPEDIDNYLKFVLNEGDVVLAMDRPVYSSGSKATKVARLTKPWENSLLLQRVGRFQTSKYLEGGFLLAYLKSEWFRQHLILSQNGSQDGKDLPHVSAFTVGSAVLPLSSKTEQAIIFAEVEKLFSVTEAVEKTISDKLKHASKFRQSILQKAFSGRLVPQDPNDEPASALLERIRAEREAAGAKGKRGKKKTADDVQPRLLEVDA